MRKFFFIIVMAFIILLDADATIAVTNKKYCTHEILVQNKSENIDYPIVDQIEAKILGGSFPKEDIYKRLDRLESKLFGSVSQKALSDRVEDLSKAVLGENDNDTQDESYTPPSGNSTSLSSDNNNLNDLLTQLESKLLNQAYPNNTQEERVSRLEKYVFNQSSNEYPMQDRIDRIAAVVKAQPSDELYKDTAQLQKLQMAGQGLALAALIIMIIAGLAF